MPTERVDWPGPPGPAVMRAIVDSEVLGGMAPTSRLAGPQLRAPLLTRYRKEMNTTAAKTNTSTRPKERSWWKITAQGYKKTISMSKMMKIIATR